jgi:hypothetical protein
MLTALADSQPSKLLGSHIGGAVDNAPQFSNLMVGGELLNFSFDLSLRQIFYEDV